MKQSINFSQFTDQFNAIRPDNFSYEGLRALYDYLEEYEEDTGEELELDVIAICCDFSEYDSIYDIAENYAIPFEDEEPEEEQEEVILNYIQDHTTMIQFNTGIIIQDW